MMDHPCFCRAAGSCTTVRQRERQHADRFPDSERAARRGPSTKVPRWHAVRRMLAQFEPSGEGKVRAITSRSIANPVSARRCEYICRRWPRSSRGRSRKSGMKRCRSRKAPRRCWLLKTTLSFGPMQSQEWRVWVIRSSPPSTAMTLCKSSGRIFLN
jgi:hypothetical protein